MGGKSKERGRERGCVVFVAVSGRGAVVRGLESQLDMGDVEGVVAAVDTEEAVLPNDNHERREDGGEDSQEDVEVGETGDAQAAQGDCNTDLSLPLL